MKHSEGRSSAKAVNSGLNPAAVFQRLGQRDVQHNILGRDLARGQASDGSVRVGELRRTEELPVMRGRGEANDGRVHREGRAEFERRIFVGRRLNWHTLGIVLVRHRHRCRRERIARRDQGRDRKTKLTVGLARELLRELNRYGGNRTCRQHPKLHAEGVVGGTLFEKTSCLTPLRGLPVLGLGGRLGEDRALHFAASHIGLQTADDGRRQPREDVGDVSLPGAMVLEGLHEPDLSSGVHDGKLHLHTP
mmetsp:Transcript_143392/g.458376  ORF Transcript_143392/g.458376 Transcript_143392/m.458376 type:complete len:249 (+) Transcript_143392:2169-2915(+)